MRDSNQPHNLMILIGRKTTIITANSIESGKHARNSIIRWRRTELERDCTRLRFGPTLTRTSRFRWRKNRITRKFPGNDFPRRERGSRGFYFARLSTNHKRLRARKLAAVVVYARDFDASLLPRDRWNNVPL